MSDRENEAAGSSAASNGAAKPTGKRQLSGATTVSAESYERKRVEQRRAAEKDANPGGGLVAFPGEVVSEVRKVIWPTGKEMVTYTLVVFAFLIVLTALVFGVDWLAGYGVDQVLVR